MSNNGFTESDRKLFRKRIPVWQEAYIDRLNRKYIEILSGNKPASEKFWELEERIVKDKNSAGVMIQMRRSELVSNIIELLREKVIEPDDLEGFSDELKQTIKFIMDREQ